MSATAAVPAHVPAGCAGGLPLFSASLPAFVICRLSEANYFDRYEVTSHCGFDLRFSDDCDAEHLSRNLLGICVPSLGMCLFRFAVTLLTFRSHSY